jgi:hypothetical protein
MLGIGSGSAGANGYCPRHLFIKPHAAIAYVCLDPIAVQLEFMDQAACGRDLGPGAGQGKAG